MSQSEEPAFRDPSLTNLLESILFVASGPVPVGRLAKVLDTTASVVNNLLLSLSEEYKSRGIRLQWTNGEVQLTTAPECNFAVERYLGLETATQLSQAALEVLSIVAYAQPVTRPRIDDIRGVNSDSALRTLLNQGLIEEQGRVDAPGRPILYGTTAEFLQHFGLEKLDDLPPLLEDEEE